MQKLIFLALALMSTSLHAQQVVTFKQAPDQHIFIAQLDSSYAPALGDSLAVFDKQEEQLIEAYTQFIKGFAQTLRDSNFVWPSDFSSEVRGFNRIYFHQDGSVAYWVYSIKKLELGSSTQLRFEKLVLEYCKTHRLTLHADQKFVQCAPVVWRQ
jgi:hypothetical protein